MSPDLSKALDRTDYEDDRRRVVETCSASVQVAGASEEQSRHSEALRCEVGEFGTTVRATRTGQDVGGERSTRMAGYGVAVRRPRRSLAGGRRRVDKPA